MVRRWAAGIVVLLLACEGLAAQVPPPPPPPPMPPMSRDSLQKPKTGTARLAGRVTALETGRPIRRAVVRAMGPELPEGKSVSTDAEGRWELGELPAARYTLSVTKGGYVTLSYGQLRPFESGKTIDLSEGQVVDKLDVALPRGSAITGRVVDEFGDPVTNARVSAMRSRFVGGQRRMVSAGSADTTDDLGQFRVHGLAPGDYYVGAQVSVSTFMSNSEDRTGYTQTFYPGVITASEATRLNLSVGQEAQNIVITMTPIRTATLSGTARTSAGTPVAQGMIMLRNADPADTSFRTGIVRGGQWTVTGVAPGDYQLMLQAVNLEQIAATGSTAQEGREIALEQLTVSGEDLRGLALVTTTGATVHGRVRFEGAATPPTIGTLSLVAMEATGLELGFSGSGAAAKADGSFEIRFFFGRRILRPVQLPAGWTLKEVTYAGADVTDTGIEAAPSQEISGVEVVLTQKAAELSGTVQTTRGAQTSDYVLVLFAAERDKWGPQSRFIRVGRPDQTGAFSMRGLPSASYLAIALEYLESGEETNPDVLERLRPLATPVSLADGEKKTISLQLRAH